MCEILDGIYYSEAPAWLSQKSVGAMRIGCTDHLAFCFDAVVLGLPATIDLIADFTFESATAEAWLSVCHNDDAAEEGPELPLPLVACPRCFDFLVASAPIHRLASIRFLLAVFVSVTRYLVAFPFQQFNFEPFATVIGKFVDAYLL